MKTCRKCGTEKPPDAFSNDRSRLDGKFPWCKECHYASKRPRAREYMRERYHADPDFRRRTHERRKEWGRRNPEAIAAWNKRWKEDNPERARDYSRRWEALKPEEAARKRHEWLSKHPDYHRDYRQKQREAAPEAFRAVQRAKGAVERAVKRGQLVRPSVCEECGATPKRIEAAHYDYRAENHLRIRWLCVSCHRKWDRGAGRRFVH